MELTNGLLEKKEFVKRISDVLKDYTNVMSIKELDYDIFEDVYGCQREYLVVRYIGGAYTVRNCCGNSLSAIYTEISKLLNGGYYDEVELYEKMKKDSKNA